MNCIKKLAFVILAIVSLNANAQTDKVTTTKIVEAKNYVFVATTAIPLNSADISNILGRIPGSMAGGAVSLSGASYDLTVTADSITAYLPFYGRAYRASFNNDENSYKFTSKGFVYHTAKRKKGWSIEITTKDVKDNVRMVLSVGENGYATLSINSMNKQAITYNGYLMEEKKKSL